MAEGVFFLVLCIGNGIYAGIKLGRAEGLCSGAAAFASWLAPWAVLIGIAIAMSVCPNRIGGVLIFCGGVAIFFLGGIIHHFGSVFIDPEPHRTYNWAGQYSSVSLSHVRGEIAVARGDSRNWYFRYSHSLHIVLYVTGVITALFGFFVLLFPSIVVQTLPNR